MGVFGDVEMQKISILFKDDVLIEQYIYNIRLELNYNIF
jgi:hypothetical protein